MRGHGLRSRLLLTVALAGFAGACTDATDPLRAATLEAVTPIVLAGTVATEVQPAVAVRARDQNGNPIQGVLVHFRLGAGGGWVTQGAVPTGADGIATVGGWILAQVARTYTLHAQSAGLNDVVFSATAAAGAPARIAVAGGSNQVAAAGTAVANPLRARVADSFDNPITGAAVTFTVVAGGGSLSGDTVFTGRDGVATSGAWTLGAGIVQQVKAYVGSHYAEFTAQAITIPPPCTAAASCSAAGQLAFARTTGIYLVNADGSGLVQIDPGTGGYGAPEWSPDGARIAFSRFNGVGSDIYLMNADGSNVIRRTNTPDLYNLNPTWSPDGRTLAFVQVKAWGSPVIYTMTADESGAIPAVLFAAPSNSWITGMSWSPDGSRIAFTYDGVLHFIQPNGSGHVVLAPSFQGYFTGRPAWSPDGRRLAVTNEDNCNWDSECELSLVLMSAAGSDMTILLQGTSLDSASDPSWSRDGTTLAYTNWKCSPTGCWNSVAYIKVDGSARGLIVADGRNPSWRP